MSNTKRPIIIATTFCLLFCFALIFQSTAFAQQSSIYVRNKGVILFKSENFVSHTNENLFAKDIAKARRNTTLIHDKNGNWPFFFLAFLKKAPGISTVNLVWYKLGKGKPEQTDYTEFTVSPNENTLQGSITLQPAQGFDPKSKYEARITILENGKEVVLARCKVNFK